jgi:5-methyltetrahydrofolate--homocysteine methyltransferase
MTREEFSELVRSKITIMDGATGSNLQKQGMPTGVCPEEWILSHPEICTELQREFLEAGSDIILAPTFTANRIKLKEYGQEDRIREYNQGLVEISKKAVEQYRSASINPRNLYIAADLTMTGIQVQPVGSMPFEELVDVYKEQLSYILPTGVDLVVIETMMSLQECRAALLAVKESCDLPVIVSLTYQENGRTLYGTDPKTAVIVLQSMGADAIGINCSTGPDKMAELVREMKEYAYVPIMAKPNAGIPQLVDGHTHFPMDPEEFADGMEKLLEAGADIVGGCCGTTPQHIRTLVDKTLNKPTSEIRSTHIRALTTETMTVELPLDGPFLVVGERINPTGKKALQEELRAGRTDMVADMASEQVELGASVLDINVGMNGIDEKEIMLLAMQEALASGKLPLSIDSSHISVIEAALRLYPGRALINSISLEKEKFEKLIPIAKKYGAMFILLPLSDQGLPKDLQEKKEIINKIIDRAQEFGLTKEDIIVDGLVTTVGANPTAAKEALETIRYCRQELGIATIVGLSNISFGLPERQFINSTFLAFAIQSGLTMAIANPSQDLLMNTSLAADLLRAVEDAPQRYIDRVSTRPTIISSGTEQSPKGAGVIKENSVDHVNNCTDQAPNQGKDIEQAVFQAVVKGNKKNIISLVEEALESSEISPKKLIEQVLIPAINEVGSLYERQIYFLPQLIAGAETMKLAIDYLEPKLQENGKAADKGTVVIATVAGDIHDIGKNLVALMLKNYGYRVIDLGKDVPTEKILRTAKEENADIIGLSALMTTTMVEMKRVVELAKEMGVTAKIIIGGAVITQSYADEIHADGYSEDAQSAVELVKRLMRAPS